MNRKETKTSRDFSMHQNGNIVETKIVAHKKNENIYLEEDHVMKT
jgi:hypothetical protein